MYPKLFPKKKVLKDITLFIVLHSAVGRVKKYSDQ